MTRRPPTQPMDWERPSERFLSYLDRLVQAAVGRDRGEVDKLLRMRMSSHLPRIVLDEMEYFRRADGEHLRAPLRLMRYHHQMHQLATAPVDTSQLPLELRERDVAAPPIQKQQKQQQQQKQQRREAGRGTGNRESSN